MSAPPRLVVVHCPDWPVAAAGGRAGVPPDAPMAVLAANRVVAASRAAREEGVEPGQRRRVAQARCPALTLVPADPAEAARAFEDVLRAVERFTPVVELTEPGTATFAARGPSRYHGGDETLATQVLEGVIGVLADRLPATGPPGVGVADGRLARPWPPCRPGLTWSPPAERRRSWPRSRSGCWPIWAWSSGR